jgi:hypothetical protein
MSRPAPDHYSEPMAGDHVQRMKAATEAVDGSHAAFIAHSDVAAALILTAVAAA